MSAATTHGNHGVDAERLPAAQAGKIKMVGLALLVLGVVLGGAGWAADHHRFAFSYLTGFMFTLTMVLGGLFFVVIQHLVKAGWSVGPRRFMENLASALPVMAVLFIPIIIFAHDLYHHWMGEHAHEDPILVKKLGWLNPGFFYGRAVVYFAIWIALALFFWRTSRKQDDTGDASLTLRMQAFSAPAVLLFGLSISFAGFDWLMSLDPHWYSTIFGIYIFAGASTSSYALLALVVIWLRSSGVLHKVITVEHQHDIGKFLFGFTVFWAYIAFSQFFLIWYANIPEETIFFRHRWVGGWRSWSYALLFLHFVVPFLLLLPRTAKRVNVLLAAGAIIHLVAHYIDMYWLVMPTLDKAEGESWIPTGATFSWVDLGGLLLPLGAVLFWVSLRLTRDPIYPLKDPRLAEAYRVDNP